MKKQEDEEFFLEYCNYMQIDLKKEPYLKELMMQGFQCPLPDGWTYDDETCIYTSPAGERIQEHPNDGAVRQQIVEMRPKNVTALLHLRVPADDVIKEVLDYYGCKQLTDEIKQCAVRFLTEAPDGYQIFLFKNRLFFKRGTISTYSHPNEWKFKEDLQKLMNNNKMSEKSHQLTPGDTDSDNLRQASPSNLVKQSSNLDGANTSSNIVPTNQDAKNDLFDIQQVDQIPKPTQEQERFQKPQIHTDEDQQERTSVVKLSPVQSPTQKDLLASSVMESENIQLKQQLSRQQELQLQQVAQLKALHQQFVDSLNQTHEQLIAQLKQNQQDEISRISTLHQVEIDDLKKQFQSSLYNKQDGNYELLKQKYNEAQRELAQYQNQSLQLNQQLLLNQKLSEQIANSNIERETLKIQVQQLTRKQNVQAESNDIMLLSTFREQTKQLFDELQQVKQDIDNQIASYRQRCDRNIYGRKYIDEQIRSFRLQQQSCVKMRIICDLVENGVAAYKGDKYQALDIIQEVFDQLKLGSGATLGEFGDYQHMLALKQYAE